MIRDEEEDMLRRGDRNNDVRILQSLLTQYHELIPEADQTKVPSPGAIDGDYGQRTEASVLGFQRYIGLEASGVANSLTLGVISAQVATDLETPVDELARSAAGQAQQDARAAHRRLDKLREI